MTPVEAAKELVLDWLAGRDLAVDDRLPPERELAGSLNLSRPALRQVLAEFEQDGLILRHVGRGTFLRRPLTDLTARRGKAGLSNRFSASPRDLWEARIAFDPAVAAAATRAARPHHLDAIRVAAAVFASADAGVWEADRNFHRSVALATDNPVLLALNDDLWAAENDARTRVLDEKRFGDAGVLEAARAQHLELCQAIEERDVDAAAGYARRHVIGEGSALLVLLV